MSIKFLKNYLIKFLKKNFFFLLILKKFNKNLKKKKAWPYLKIKKKKFFLV